MKVSLRKKACYVHTNRNCKVKWMYMNMSGKNGVVL